MNNSKINILRLDHRRRRDARITTHVCLTARAFGASKIILSGDEDNKLMENVRDVIERWGGNFSLDYRKNWWNLLEEWKKDNGEIIHLTMYGLPVQEAIKDIRGSKHDKLVIVGGSRVPGKVYQESDWNVSVTAQPHSEVSALAIFLHLYFEGHELSKEFKGGKLKIVPSSHGKKILEK